MSRQDTAGTHRGATQSTPGTWFQGDAQFEHVTVDARDLAFSCVVDAGKRLPLYGVVGATFAFAGYAFFFNTAKHPAAASNPKSDKLPGEGQEKQAQGTQALRYDLEIMPQRMAPCDKLAFCRLL